MRRARSQPLLELVEEPDPREAILGGRIAKSIVGFGLPQKSGARNLAQKFLIVENCRCCGEVEWGFVEQVPRVRMFTGNVTKSCIVARRRE